MRANNGPFVSLEHAFHRIFSNSLLNYKITLFTIGASTVEICRPFPEVFKIFDSHSNMSIPFEMKGVVCDQVDIAGMQVPALVSPQSPYVLKNSDNKKMNLRSQEIKENLKSRNHARMVRQNETAEKRAKRL